MDEPTPEEHVRKLAYQLWEQAGCPEGRSEEFWQQAKKELGVQTDALEDEGTADKEGPPASSDR
jgi:hypothetical protein